MYTLSGIKTFNGTDGQGLNATLVREGKKVAFILDEGCGGEVRIDFLMPVMGKAVKRDEAQKEEAAFAEFAAKWYAESEQAKEDAKEFDDSDRTPRWAMESWINHFIDELQNKKRFDRIAKKKVLFRLKGDKPEEWRTLNGGAYSPNSQAYLDANYPGKVEQIWGVDPKAAS